MSILDISQSAITPIGAYIENTNLFLKGDHPIRKMNLLEYKHDIKVGLSNIPIDEFTKSRIFEVINSQLPAAHQNRLVSINTHIPSKATPNPVFSFKIFMFAPSGIFHAYTVMFQPKPGYEDVIRQAFINLTIEVYGEYGYEVIEKPNEVRAKIKG